MSTAVVVRCAEHNDESDYLGSIWSYLTEVQEMIADRDRWVALENEKLALEGEFITGPGYGPIGGVMRFFRDHPTCEILIFDEYGRQHPTKPEPDKTPVDWVRQIENWERSFQSFNNRRCRSDAQYIERLNELLDEGVVQINLSMVEYLAGRGKDWKHSTEDERCTKIVKSLKSMREAQRSQHNTHWINELTGSQISYVARWLAHEGFDNIKTNEEN